MATAEQIQDLSRFIDTLPEQDRQALSMDEIYDRWRSLAIRHEDLLAVKASLWDFDQGERGRPLEDFLAEFDAENSPSASET